MGKWLSEAEQETRMPAVKRFNRNKGHLGYFTMVNCVYENDEGKLELHCQELKGRPEDVVQQIQSTKQ